MKKIFTVLFSLISLVTLNSQSYSFKEMRSGLAINNGDVYNYTVDLFDSKYFEFSVTNNSNVNRRFRLKKTEISTPANANYSQTVCTQNTCYSTGNFFPPIDNSSSYGESLAPGATSVNLQGKPSFTFELKLSPQTAGLYQFRFTFQDSSNVADSISFQINYTAVDPTGIKDIDASKLFPSITKNKNTLLIGNPYNNEYVLEVFQADGKKLLEQKIEPRSYFQRALYHSGITYIKLRNSNTLQYTDLKYSFIE